MLIIFNFEFHFSRLSWSAMHG